MPIAIGLLVVALAGTGLFWFLRPVGDRPNIVLITIDTLRADHLGVYGYERLTSPNLSALADEGVVFDNAFTQAALSGPSHATILTGLDPLSHGVASNAVTLADHNLTLAEILGAAGYRTAMYVSHYLLTPKYGFGQGFDRRRIYSVPAHGLGHGHEKSPGRSTPEKVFEKAREWLREQPRDPFFLWLHIQHPHKSYEPPPPYDSMFVDAPNSEHELTCWYTLDRHEDGEIELTDQEREYVVALYDGEIRYVDDQLRKLFVDLRKTGLDENTIVAITADHGEGLFDDPEQLFVGHGRHRTDPVLRVPLILRGPGIPEGERRKAMVGLIDVAPTLLDLVGIPVPTAFQGSSLRAWLDADLSEGPREHSFSVTQTAGGKLRLANRGSRYKTTCDVEDGRWSCKLFDQHEDPFDHDDLAQSAAHAERIAEMRGELEQWLRDGLSHGEELARSAAEAREILRRAGYLE